MGDAVDPDRVKRMLGIHQRNLSFLEESVVLYGGEPFAPLELRNKLDLVRSEIIKLQTPQVQLAVLPDDPTTQPTSFLDQHPPDWTRPEVVQLRDLFVIAYKSRASAEELADSAGIRPGTFPYYDNMRTTWYYLIQELSKQGKLRVLVQKAAADVTISAFQQRFAEMLQGKPTVPVTMPNAGTDWWKGEDTDPSVARQVHLQRLIEQRSRLIDVDIARQIAELSGSVAKLDLRFEDNNAHGTGFLIQPDLILTNCHNVSDAKYGEVRGLTAEFDFEQRFPSSLKPLVRKGLLGMIHKNEAHDWALVQLEQPVDRKVIPLGTPFDVGKGDHVIIIQHPLGAFKQFAVDMLSVRYADDHIIQYLADTQNGSSGAPVFNIRMQVIALHHAETEVSVSVDGRVESEWRNEGIRIEQVMKDLRGLSIKFETN